MVTRSVRKFVSVTRASFYRTHNDDPAGWYQEATSPKNHAILKWEFEFKMSQFYISPMELKLALWIGGNISAITIIQNSFLQNAAKVRIQNTNWIQTNWFYSIIQPRFNLGTWTGRTSPDCRVIKMPCLYRKSEPRWWSYWHLSGYWLPFGREFRKVWNGLWCWWSLYDWYTHWLARWRNRVPRTLTRYWCPYWNQNAIWMVF